jgi:hypothetical protein
MVAPAFGISGGGYRKLQLQFAAPKAEVKNAALTVCLKAYPDTNLWFPLQTSEVVPFPSSGWKSACGGCLIRGEFLRALRDRCCRR